MAKQTKVFDRVSLKLDPNILHPPNSTSSILQGKTVTLKNEGNYIVASSTDSFQDVRDTYRRCVVMQKTNTGTRDLRQRDVSVKGQNATGLGSAQSNSLIAEPVHVDDIVMEYIHKKKSKEFERIEERHAVNIIWHSSLVSFSPQTGIQAQFAREQFITLYQKTATGLQIRTYACNPKMVSLCYEEFPELLITPYKDKKRMTLTGSFISLERFEELLNGSAQKCTQHQTPSKTSQYDTPRKQSVKQDKPTDQAKDETCPICLEPMKTYQSTVLSKCKHRFCEDCLKMAFQLKPACPICGEIYGNLTGTQPKGGTMTVSKDSSSLPGYERYGTIVISYHIPSGLQGDEHPNPGTTYQGASRIAYLPDSPEGKHILKLLQRAFDQRLTFTIGRSSTTGRNNVVTWNDIHHKTSRDGGPTQYGYPDQDYLKRVQDELKVKGIY